MLSHEALALFRQHIERHGDIEVDDSNRCAGYTKAANDPVERGRYAVRWTGC
jgi:hypothetical protein